MRPTVEQSRQIEQYRSQYEQLKLEGQKRAPNALPGLTPRSLARPGDSATIVREIIPGGWYWTTSLAKEEALRLVNVTGRSCVSLLAWNSSDSSERLNHADTIKVQWAAKLQKGRVILSDMGRVLLSITEDTSGRHDAIVGASTPGGNRSRYGASVRFRNTRENFLSAAAKLGLERRDVHPCISFFAPVVVGTNGHFEWEQNVRQVGDFVDIRAEMDLKVAISNCPHPLDPSSSYDPGDVEIIRFRSSVSADDICRTISSENIRAFENNASNI